MKKFKVVVTAPIREEGLTLLKKEAEILLFQKTPTEEQLIEAVRDTDALLVTLNVEKISKKVIDSAPKLKIIARHGVGYDNVDIKVAKEKGIWVTITPVLSETVADMAFALLMALSRKICEANLFVKSKKWITRDPFLFTGVDVSGKTIGIIGLGRIGYAIAERAKGFKMKIIYYDIIRKKEIEEKEKIEYLPLENLLRESDYVIISCPLTEQTKGLIGESQLRIMKNTAFLINVARGPIIDHNALIKALREKWIAGAGLDVFYQEPLPQEDPILTLENVVLTPHLASNTIECRKRMAITAAEEILRVLHGEKPRYPVT